MGEERIWRKLYIQITFILQLHFYVAFILCTTYILTVAKYLFQRSMYFVSASVFLNKSDEVNVSVICGHLVVY